MNNKILSTLKFIIGWPLSIISLFFVFRLIINQSNQIIPSITQSDLKLILIIPAVFSFLTYYLFRSLLWQKILETKNHQLTFKESAYFWTVSEFKRYVPGNIWSFLSRANFLSNKQVEKQNIFSVLIIEIELIVLGCSILSLLALSYVTNDNSIIIISCLTVFLFTVIFIFGKTIGEKFKTIKNLLPSGSIFTNLILITISTVTFFAFGLGSYFACASLFYVDPWYLFGIIGFLVFALLAGYLSIITPMGLGVREGIVTLTLGKFIGFSAAAVVSIFSRIILIFSELIFLALVIFWYKTKSKLIFDIQDFIGNHKQEIILGIMIFIYIVYFTTASFLRYDNFYTGRFDLGNMDQAVWNTSQGRIFQITDPDGTNVISRLSFHADFILILISPLYLLWSSPKMILLLQTIVLGLGAYFVYLIARQILKNKNTAFILGLAFLLNPAVQFSNLYDFHGVTLATTLLLAAFYFFINKAYLKFLVFALLAAFTKEQIWLVISFFGLIPLLKFIKNYFLLKIHKLRKNELVTIISGIVFFLITVGIFYYLVWHLIPDARGGNHFALSYYSDFGISPSSIVRNIILSPIKTISTILQPDKLDYLNQLFLPLGFLSFLSPFYLIFATPDLIINLLSNNDQLHQIYYQYTTSITPFIFISTIFGINFLRKYFSKIHINIINAYLIITVIFTAISFGPLPGSPERNINMFTNQLYNKGIIENFLNQIPKEYSVAATNNLGSHLSHRQKIYTIPIGMEEADVIVFLLNDRFAQPSLERQKEMVESLRANPEYIEILSSGDFVAFQRNTVFTY